MFKKSTTVSIISFLMLLAANSIFAESDSGSGKENFDKIENLAFVGILKTYQTNWTNWQTMSDGKSNGVDIRWKRGNFKYDGGNYDVFWHLRNRYQKDVRLSFKLNYTKTDGSPYTTSEVIRVDAGQIADSIGQTSIAYSLRSYQVTKIEFLDSSDVPYRIGQ